MTKIKLIQIQNIHVPFKPYTYVPFKLKYFCLRNSDTHKLLQDSNSGQGTSGSGRSIVDSGGASPLKITRNYLECVYFLSRRNDH